MEAVQRLRQCFDAVIAVMPGAERYILNPDSMPPNTSILLCLNFYESPKDMSDNREAVIHPYYLMSQRDHILARDLEKETGLILRNDILLKPVLMKLSCFRRGVNTLSYFDGKGSRFHIKCFENPSLPWVPLEAEKPEATCLKCGACISACPGKAITWEGFLRENCLRNWMLSGKVPPGQIRAENGNRLIGCDVCQMVCPMNPAGLQPSAVIPLRTLLQGGMDLGEMLGTNLAIPNRVLVQACIIAGAMKRTDLAAEVETLRTHPSPAVREAAESALAVLSCAQNEKGL